MDENTLKALDLELAILYRRITSITIHRRIGNLDRSAYLLLHHLSSHGTAGVKALAAVFHLDISTVSRQAAALEKKGYVNKVQNQADGRANDLEITELGTKELVESNQARLHKLEEVFIDWSQEERHLFGQLLNKFNQSVIQKVDV